MKVIGEAEAACELLEKQTTLETDDDCVITPYLVRGMYKIAREKELAGECGSARRIYLFLADRYHLSPRIKSCEIALSLAALARLAADKGYFLEAEQYLIKALAACVDHLGEAHPVTVETFQQYGSLLRAMNLGQEALVVERRAAIKEAPALDDMTAEDFVIEPQFESALVYDSNYDIDEDVHQLPLAS
jgi:hypothetical protein